MAVEGLIDPALVQGFFSQGAGVIIFAVCAMIFIIFVGGMMYYLQFNIAYHILVMTSGRPIIITTTAKEVMTKNERCLRLWLGMRFKKVPLPPKESVITTPNGRKVVMAIRHTSGTIQYAKWPNKFDGVDIEGLNSTDTNMIIDQIYQAYARNPKGWKEVIVPMTALICCTIIVVALFMFADKIINGFADLVATMGELVKEVKSLMSQAMLYCDRSNNNGQIIPIGDGG